MIRYNRSYEHDLLLLGWYHELLISDDMPYTFMPSTKPLGAWMALMRQCHLYFQVDDKGIWWACWYEPAYGGVMYAMWCRSDRRKSRDNVALTMQALEEGLREWGTVFGITKQAALLELHRRLGYTIVGDVPGLWEGGSAWLVVLTPATFAEGVFYGWWQKRKQPERRSVEQHGPALVQPDA